MANRSFPQHIVNSIRVGPKHHYFIQQLPPIDQYYNPQSRQSHHPAAPYFPVQHERAGGFPFKSFSASSCRIQTGAVCSFIYFGDESNTNSPECSSCFFCFLFFFWEGGGHLIQAHVFNCTGGIKDVIES